MHEECKMFKWPGKLAVPFLWVYHGDFQLLFALGKNQSEMLGLSKWKQPGV